jgi:hypothetical protein
VLDAYELTDETLFRDYALAYLKAYARYGYDDQTGRFWGCLRLDGTPEFGPRVVGGYAQYEPRGHIDLWQPYAAGYEHPTRTAQMYVRAYGLTHDPSLRDAALRWATFIRDNLPATRCLEDTWYRDYSLAWAPHGTYAGKYGRTISFLCRLQGATGDPQYGRLARELADEAICRLYYRGWFRGHPAKPYYESIDDVGDLLLGLLELHETSSGKAG